MEILALAGAYHGSMQGPFGQMEQQTLEFAGLSSRDQAPGFYEATRKILPR